MGLFRRTKSTRKNRNPARRRLTLEPLETRSLLALDLAAIGGAAFVDLTGNGLTPDDTLVGSAAVQLYRDNGDGVFNALTDTLLGSTTTDGTGAYRFADPDAGGALPAGTLTAGNYFVRQLPQAGFTPPAAALVTLTQAMVDGQTVRTIDAFDTTSQTVTADVVNTTAASSVAATEVIGGERDVRVHFISGNGDVSVQIDRYDSNRFAFVSGLNVVGNAVLQYDGADGDANALNATGLGGASLSAGDAHAGLHIASRGDASGATLVIRVYSSAVNYSTATVSVPHQVDAESIFVPFSAFSVAGGTGASFASVGAIELVINGVAEVDGTVSVLGSLRPNQTTVNLQNLAPSIEIVKSVNGQDANTAPGPYVSTGSTVTFTYVVRAIGGVSLQNVVVTDDNGTSGSAADDFNPTRTGGDTNGNNILETTETWTYQATRTATAGAYANIGRVAAEDLSGTPVADSDPSNYFGVSAAIVLVKSANGQDANTATGPVVAVGSTATFTYVVTNPGNVPLNNIVVTDDNGTSGNAADDFSPAYQGGDTNSNGRLETTETWTYQATRTVTAGQYGNIGTVVGNPVDASGVDLAGMANVTDTDPSHLFGATAGIHLVKSTNGQDANSAPGVSLAVGSTATFTYVVTNTGNVPLDNVEVTDDNGTSGNVADDFSPAFQGGDTNLNGRLETTETWTYQATRTVTAGQYTNTAVVTANPVDTSGTDIAGLADVSDSDPSNHLGVTAAIHLVKSTNGDDANTATGPTLAVGGTATFTYVVTNTGATALASVVLRDDNGTAGSTGDDFTPTYVGGDANSNGRLETTETWTYRATRTVTAGQYTNTAVVTANPVDTTGADIAGLADVSDDDPSNHIGVVTGIKLVKSVNGHDANTATGPYIAVAGTATFTYVVTNTGQLALASVVLRDDSGTASNTSDDFSPTYVSGDANSNGRLDTTETWTYQASRSVVTGQYTNIGRVVAQPVAANGTAPAGVGLVSYDDVSNYFGYTVGLTLRKLTNGIDTGTGPGPSLTVGSTATFTYQATNTGNAPLTSVVIVDDNGTAGNSADDFHPTRTGGDTDGDNQLDPGETWTYTGTRTVTLGAYSNTVVVSANDPNASPVTAQATSAHQGIRRLSKRLFTARGN